MREYGKVSPQFWVGRTGRSLRGNLEAQIVALYLMTSPHANMIGVFYCPVEYIAKETGLPIEGASKGLQSLIKADFCTFEGDSEYVFVHQFAANQIGTELKASDKRVQGVINELAKVPKGQCWQAFRARYAVPYNLPLPGHQEPETEAPSKPLRSQEQEQEQKQNDSAQKKRKTKFPEDFAPNQTGVNACQQAGCNLAEELRKFRDHHEAKGTLMLDWQAGFRTWVNNAMAFRKPWEKPAAPLETFV